MLQVTGTVARIYNPSTRTVGQKNEEFKVIFGNTKSFRPPWAAGDPVPNKQTKNCVVWLWVLMGPSWLYVYRRLQGGGKETSEGEQRSTQRFCHLGLGGNGDQHPQVVRHGGEHL